MEIEYAMGSMPGYILCEGKAPFIFEICRKEMAKKEHEQGIEILKDRFFWHIKTYFNYFKKKKKYFEKRSKKKIFELIIGRELTFLALNFIDCFL